MKKTNFIILILFISVQSIKVQAQKTIRIIDQDGHPIHFLLQCGLTSFKSDSSGKITFRRSDLSKYCNECFSIAFVNPNDRFLYRYKLFLTRLPIKNTADKNYLFSELYLSDLFIKKENVFFVREKKNYLEGDD